MTYSLCARGRRCERGGIPACSALSQLESFISVPSHIFLFGCGFFFFDEICRKRVNATRMQKAPRSRGGGENGKSLLPPPLPSSDRQKPPPPPQKTLPLSLPPPLSLYPPPFSERSLCNSISFSGHKRGREGGDTPFLVRPPPTPTRPPSRHVARTWHCRRWERPRLRARPSLPHLSSPSPPLQNGEKKRSPSPLLLYFFGKPRKRRGIYLVEEGKGSGLALFGLFPPFS